MRGLTVLAAYAALLALPAAAQQVCNDAMPASAPGERYVAGADGTVLDRRTGLMWSACSLGQSWSDGVCLGEPVAMDWYKALAEAQAADWAGHPDWRLPNFKELLSLVERACADPAINAKLFAAPASGNYWSGSAAYDDPELFKPLLAWAVDFGDGDFRAQDRDLGFYVRLVRVP